MNLVKHIKDFLNEGGDPFAEDAKVNPVAKKHTQAPTTSATNPVQPKAKPAANTESKPVAYRPDLAVAVARNTQIPYTSLYWMVLMNDLYVDDRDLYNKLKAAMKKKGYESIVFVDSLGPIQWFNGYVKYSLLSDAGYYPVVKRIADTYKPAFDEDVMFNSITDLSKPITITTDKGKTVFSSGYEYIIDRYKKFIGDGGASGDSNKTPVDWESWLSLWCMLSQKVRTQLAHDYKEVLSSKRDIIMEPISHTGSKDKYYTFILGRPDPNGKIEPAYLAYSGIKADPNIDKIVKAFKDAKAANNLDATLNALPKKGEANSPDKASAAEVTL